MPLKDLPTINIPIDKGQTDKPNTLKELPKINNEFNGRESSREYNLPVSKYTDYIETVYPNLNIDEKRAQAQSRTERWMNAVPRLISKTGSEIAKTPGYLYALGEAGLTESTLAESLNNAWINKLENLDQKTKEEFQIYTPESVKTGNLWDNISSASFWTNEGIDGAGFLIGMMAPGAVLKFAGLSGAATSAFTRLGVGASKAARLGSNVELGTATLLNTTLESAAEAKGAADDLSKQFEIKISKGEINSSTGQPWTKEESDAAVNDAAKGVFQTNMALLIGPNFVMNKNLLGRFTPTKNAINKVIDNTGKIVDVSALTRKEIISQAAKNIGIGLFSEGFVEEAGQFSIENYYKKLAKNETTDGLLSGLAEEYANALTTTDGQKAILLGGVFGSLGAYHGLKEQKKEREYASKLSKMLKTNFEGFSKTMDDLYVKKEDGSVELDENNNPVLNDINAVQVLVQIINENKSSQMKDVYAMLGNKEAFDFITNQEFIRFAIPYLQQEGGLDVLNKHIEALSSKMAENRKTSEGVDTYFEEGQYRAEMKQKAKDLQEVHDQVKDFINTLDISKSTDEKTHNEFVNKLINASFQEVSKQMFLSDRINKLSGESAQLSIGSAAELPQVKLQIEKVEKQIKSYQDALSESIDIYNDLFQPEKVEKAKSDFVKEKAFQEEQISNSKKETQNKQQEEEILEISREELANEQERITLEKKDEIEKLKERAKTQIELETAFNSVSNLKDISPFSRVKYNNKEGYISKHPDENTYIFTDDNGKMYDIPKDEEFGNDGKLYDYGIFELPKESPVSDLIDIYEVDGKVSIIINGEEYFNNFSNPLMAINRNTDGGIVSINLETNDGKKRTFKKYAEEIAYSILLYTYNKLENETQGAREDVKSRLTEATSKSDNQRKESNPSKGDSEESRKIEEAIQKLNDGIKESNNLFNSQIEKIFEKERVQKETADDKFKSSTSEKKESKPEIPEQTDVNQGVIEDEELVNTKVITDDSNDESEEGRKASTVFKTNSGDDNSSLEVRELFYNTVEKLKLDGHKLLVVTKVTNPELYKEILGNDPVAKEFESKNPDYKGIWTVLANKDGSLHRVDGKLIQATLETAKRVSDKKIDIGRGLSEKEKAAARVKAMADINSLRGQIIGSSDGKFAPLRSGTVSYLPIIGKSKGLFITDSHSAFEPKIEGQRQSNNVVGRIFKSTSDLKNTKLALPTFNLVFEKVKVLPGKLYTMDNNGRVFDLIPRLTNDFEIELITNLIEKQLKDKDLDFSPKDEIKKLISFYKSKKSSQYDIYINDDNRLVFNGIEVSGETFETDKQKIVDFLKTKRVNVNTRYINGETFTSPDINGVGIEENYNEYLLSGEAPMFGTDLKKDTERRFLQSYFIYDNKLESEKLKDADINKSDEIINDNGAPVTDGITLPPKKTFIRKPKETLDRLDKISKDRTKISQSEKDWFKQRFKNVPIEIVKGLIEGRSLGQFIDSGSVLLSDEATVGTLQHEAFHVITQLYLSKEEIDALYAEAAIRHPGKTRLELEEILAEDFVNYKKNGEILKSSPKRNTIFRRLLNAIKDFFGMSTTDIQQVYERLDKGYYTNAKIVGNREFSKLNRDEYTQKLTKDKGTKFTKDVLDGFDRIFFKHIFNGGSTPISVSSNMNEILNKMFEDFNDVYQKSQNVSLSNDYEYILENFDDIVKVWDSRLALNGVDTKILQAYDEIGEIKGDEESANKEEDDRPFNKDSYQEGNLTSPLETISSPVRLLIRSLGKVDYKNDLEMEVPVDFQSTYNYLLKKCAGIGSSYTDLYSRIELLSNDKPEFKELLERIGKPAWDINDEKFDFQTKFLMDFSKNRIDSIITVVEPDGNIRIVDANRQNEADKARMIWEANIRDKATLNDKGQLMIDVNVNNITDPVSFLNALGITFEKSTLSHINSEDFDKSDLSDSAEAIRKYISFHDGDVTNLFTADKKESDDAKKVSVAGNRMMYLLNLEAQHTSLINELSFFSVESKTEYSITENNGLSITTNIINNSKTKAELFNKLPHLNTVGVEGSLWINQMFDKDGNRIPKTYIKLELHNGIRSSAESEDDLRVPTRKGTEGDMFTQQMASILNGKSNYIVSADKSQEFVLLLVNYNGNQKLPIPIEAFEKGVNNVKLKQIFRDYFKSEFKRIALFEIDGLGKNVDTYGVDSKGKVGNGNKFTIFQDILKGEIKTDIKREIDKYKDSNYSEVEDKLNEFVDGILPQIDSLVVDFFGHYSNEFKNALIESDSLNAFPKELKDKYNGNIDQLIRAVVVTDFINSTEQSKLFIGDTAFYKDLYKRTSMFAGTKTIPRIDGNMDLHLINKHPRKDGKLADGKEKTVIYADVKTTKDVSEYVKSYISKGFKEEEAYNVLGFVKNESGEYVGDSAYGSADEGDAMGWGSLDFYKEFYKRIGQWSDKMENAYQTIQNQVYDNEGNLTSGELLSKDQIVLFKTIKLQYAGPIEHGSVNGLFVPGGYKFTVMPLIPQMVAGKNLSKILDSMIKDQTGIRLFKSGSKFGTIVNDKGKANKFYEDYNNGGVPSETPIIQTISYQYLGLQVKPSDPKNEYVMSTQFRKTMLINAFENGREAFKGAKDLLDEYNRLIDVKAQNDLNDLIKDLGIDPVNYTAKDISKLVDLLSEAAESRKLTDNIINSIDTEIVNGKTLLKYNIDSMVNKPKIDSMLMALVNSRLIRQKVNGDAYVLAPVTGMESVGVRNVGTNSALRGYTVGEDGKTLPAEVMVPISRNYYPLLKKYGNLKALNAAIKNGEIDENVLQMVGCRIPGQGMNSNEFLTIAEFLPEDSATTMIAHPDITAKAGSDFDNDKLYTYRPSIDENGDYIKDDNDNKMINVIKQFISHEHNFLSLITPNSTNLITPLVDDIKYNKYLNEKSVKNKDLISKGKEAKKPLSKEDYIKTQKDLASNIKYTDLLKLHKKVKARYKLWSAKDEVGPAAIANAYGPLAQIGNLTANKTYNKKGGGQVKVDINLPHNEIDGLFNLSAIKDADGKNNISEINNQLINIIVDAAKDEEPMVTHLNMTIDTLSIYLYLNRLGVPFEYSSALMTQPIITEWIKGTSKRRSVHVSVSGTKGAAVSKTLNKKYSAGLTKDRINDYQDVVFNLESLKANRLIENQYGEDYYLQQLQVLKDFLAYQEQARMFGDAVRVTNSDSAGVGQNINAERFKLSDAQKVKDAKFINGVNDIIENTFIKSFQRSEFTIGAYSQFYDTQAPVINNSIMDLAKDIEDQNPFMNKQDKIRIVNLIENEFINFVTQNFAYKNVSESIKSMFTGENSVAKELNRLKNKDKSNLTPDEVKLLDNLIVKELFPLIDKAKPGTDFDNVKIFSKKLDTFTSNQLTEAFRELKDSKIKLGTRLMHLGILQSGLNNSPIAYTGLIPFEYYNQMVKDAFVKFNQSDVETNLLKFNELFLRNNKTDKNVKGLAEGYSKLGMGMYGKNYSLSNASEIVINDKLENAETSTPSEYTPENIVSLKSNEVFVFGSNTEGRHGKGAALLAKQKFGAIYGNSEGLQGQSYAIITKDLSKGEKSIPLWKIQEQLDNLFEYAVDHRDKKFYVTKLGSSLAGYKAEEIKGLIENIVKKFKGNANQAIPNNIILPKEYEVRDDVSSKTVNSSKSKPVLIKDTDNANAGVISNSELNRIITGSSFKTKLFDNQLAELSRKIGVLNNSNAAKNINVHYAVENIKSAGGTLFDYNVVKYNSKLDLNAKAKRAVHNDSRVSSVKDDMNRVNKTSGLNKIKEQDKHVEKEKDLFSDLKDISDNDVKKKEEECK